MADALQRFKKRVRSANVLNEHAKHATFTKRCEARRLRKALARLVGARWSGMPEDIRRRVAAARDAAVRKCREQAVMNDL